MTRFGSSAGAPPRADGPACAGANPLLAKEPLMENDWKNFSMIKNRKEKLPRFLTPAST